MARPVVTDTQPGFGGGLNTVSADSALLPNQFRRGDNGRLTAIGAFVKRGGTQRIHTSALSGANAIQNGYAWHQSSGTTVTMAVTNGTLFTGTYGSFPITFTQRGATGALSTTVTPCLEQFISGTSTDAVYIADGGLLNKYSGTTLTTNIASTAQCTHITAYNQRLWGCGYSTYPDSIFYSALNDGDSLGVGASGGGQIVVRTFGDQDVIAVEGVGTSLLIFHRSGISRLTGYGQSDLTAYPAAITGDVGTIAQFSIQRVDNVCYFVSSRGLYIANEAQAVPVATADTPDPLSVILPHMSAANIATITTVLNRGTRELYIMVPGYGVYIWNLTLSAWSGPWVDGYLSPETTAMFETDNSSGYPIIIRGDSSGFLSECDAPNALKDNIEADGTGGTSFVMALQCRRMYGGDPVAASQIAKAWRFGYLLADIGGSNATTVSCVTDTGAVSTPLPVSTGQTWNASGTVWNQGTWNAVAQKSYRVQMANSGYFVDVTITDSGTAMPTISQFTLQAFALGRR